MIIMGRVAGAQGILGWVKLKTYTEFVDGLADFPVWWLGDEKHPWREISVEKFAVQGKGLIAKFPGCNDRTAAEKYKGLLVAVPRSSLPQQAEDEYYWTDLIGLAVVNLAGESLGTVDNLMDTGANQVLCVRGASGEILIPFIASAIRQVDLAARVIRVDWSVDWAEKHPTGKEAQ
ncbi:Ribosome maturation factor RimM [Gallionellaceae bacterium]|nr:Ribosome maturation factor RimM [Gallionellaceae bacterium]